MNTTSKLFYDRLAGFAFLILMIGLIGYQLLTLWFIGPIFLVLLYTYCKRLQLLHKAKINPAAYTTLLGLLAVLGLYVFYVYRGSKLFQKTTKKRPHLYGRGFFWFRIASLSRKGKSNAGYEYALVYCFR